MGGAIVNAIRQIAMHNPNARGGLEALGSELLLWGIVAALFFGALFVVIRFVRWTWRA